MTNSMINYQTTFEATQNLVKTIGLGHGENADLVADFTDNGVPVELSGFTARALYQPKSAWGTNNWYECPCEISGNTAIAHWGNAYDNGENAVKLFMHLTKDNKVAYPAIYQIRLFETPGFIPSTIDPIPVVIDFSQYTLLNAPWAMLSDFNTLNSNFSTLSTETDELMVDFRNLMSEMDKKTNLSTFNNLSTTVNHLGQDVENNTNDISTLSTNVSGLSRELSEKADVSSILPNSGVAMLNGSLFVYEPEYGADALQVRWNGMEVYPAGSQSYRVTMPLSAGRLALESQVSAKADTSAITQLSGDVSALSASTLKTSQLITAITSSATDLQVPTGKAVYDAIQEGGGGGGGATRYTVTVANNFSIIADEHAWSLTSAPLICIKSDGTTQTIDLATSPSGTTVTDVVEVRSGTWTLDECTFRRSMYYRAESGAYHTAGDIFSTYNYILLSNGYRIYAKLDSSSFGRGSPFDELRTIDSFLSRMILTGDITISNIEVCISCILRGTPIRLANGKDKPIEEITYDDELLVWDFDNGCLASAKPLWIKKPQIAPYYFRNILASGKELLTTGKSKTGWGHRMFDIDKEMFRYTTETVADRIYTLDGIEIHKSCERIVKECEFYNIITEKHFNLFANGILTSCSLNNLYPISGMKFKKENREFRPFEAYDVPLKYYKGLRLGEQNEDVNSLNDYVRRLVEVER